MAIYELHEFNPDKIFTGAINPSAVKNIKHIQFERSTTGTVIIDKNKDLSSHKQLISLATTKTSQKKFNQVIDIEFADFPLADNGNAIQFLITKIEQLEQDRANALATRDVDRSQIDALNNQIETLKNQIANQNKPLVNEVPDTLTAGNFLWSDRNGEPGAPGYPKIENKLLSKNRKAKGTIQPDGNFVIYVGDDNTDSSYDTRGELLPGKTHTPVFAKGYNTKSGIAGAWIYAPENSNDGQFELVRNDFQLSRWSVEWGSGRQKLSKASRLVLDDNGYLMLYDGATVKWSSFGA
jgi:hypothetical protein